MTFETDTASLERCRQLIEQKLNWPPAGEWRQFEFAELSDRILDATGVQLSTTTLKRIFGKVRYESLPSSGTLNALANFLGYANWMEFRSARPAETQRVAPDAPITGKRSIRKRNIAIALLAFIPLLMLFGFMLLGKPPQTKEEIDAVVFTSRPLAQGLPNSVVFNVDLKNIRTDDILIQQSWDSTRTVRLQPGQQEATAIYYVPGYFRAKLLVNKKIIREHDLFIRSDNWMATIDNDPYPPVYLHPKDLLLQKGLAISDSAMAMIRNQTKPATLTYHLVRPFDSLHSDNFSLETTFQNTWGEGAAVCRTTKLFILCTRGAFIIPFTIPGCASDINLKLGSREWKGKENDLSAFGIDPSRAIHLEVQVQNRVVKIYANDRLLKQESYSENAGDIVGLRYSFLGAGTVNDIKLVNEKGKVVYHFQGR